MFASQSVEEHYRALHAAVAEAKPDAVVVQSIVAVPCANNGGSVWEDTRMLAYNGAGTAKTEYNIPLHLDCVDGFTPGGDVDDDLLVSFGFALARDGAAAYAGAKNATNGRPPHIWIPDVETMNISKPADYAVALSYAVQAYGGIANLDHSEKKIPDYEVFRPAYKQPRRNLLVRSPISATAASTDYPRRGRGAAATRLRGASTEELAGTTSPRRSTHSGAATPCCDRSAGQGRSGLSGSATSGFPTRNSRPGPTASTSRSAAGRRSCELVPLPRS